MPSPRRRPHPLSGWLPDIASRIYFGLSVLLAILLWAFTVGESRTIKEMEAPVIFASVPEGCAITGPDSHKSVTVQVKGSPDILKRVREEDIEVRVDMSRASPGPQMVALTHENVRVPSSIELAKIYPGTLHVSLDKLVIEGREIQPSFSGKPASDLAVVGWSIDPPTAKVKGPQALLRKLAHLGTQPISLDGRTASFQETVVPVSGDPDITVLPGTFWNIKVNIGERSRRRVINSVPVSVLNSKLRATTVPESVSLGLEGPERFVNSLAAGDFRVEIDIEGLAPGETPYQIKPVVRPLKRDITGRLEITSVSPPFISVTISKP